MKLTDNLTKVYKESFKEILEPIGFILKGSLFIRLIGEEIIQTVSIFKRPPFDFTLNIGIFPFSRNNDKDQLNEGIFRLYDFVDSEAGSYLKYNPQNLLSITEELKKCVSQFKNEVLPIFESVQTQKDFLIFLEKFEMEKYGEINYLDEKKLYINLKLRNYSSALIVIEEYTKQKTSALTEKYKDEFEEEEKFELFLNGRLQKFIGLKNAIESNNIDYLNKIVQTNVNITKSMLKDFGYKF